MSEPFVWHVTFAIKASVDRLREITAKVVDVARAEPGVLAYECFISADQKTLHWLETYRDEAALLEHAQNPKLLALFPAAMECLAPTGSTIYGSPSEAARAAVAPFAPAFMTPFGGFRR
jgi:quinol monooxygenase YgiN